MLSVGVALVQFWPDGRGSSLVAGIFAVGQFLEGNILQPRLVGSSIGVHPVWLMFALFAFGSLFGFVGVLLAVPVTAAIGVLVRFAIERYRASRLYLERATAGRPRTGCFDARRLRSNSRWRFRTLRAMAAKISSSGPSNAHGAAADRKLAGLAVARARASDRPARLRQDASRAYLGDRAGAEILAADRAGRSQRSASSPAAPSPSRTSMRHAVPEQALFHLINRVVEARSTLLLTSRSAAEDWRISLPDLRSRLRLAAPAALGAPDDELLRQVLVKLFADRQLIVDKPVIDYLLLQNGTVAERGGWAGRSARPGGAGRGAPHHAADGGAVLSGNDADEFADRQ